MLTVSFPDAAGCVRTPVVPAIMYTSPITGGYTSALDVEIEPRIVMMHRTPGLPGLSPLRRSAGTCIGAEIPSLT